MSCEEVRGARLADRPEEHVVRVLVFDGSVNRDSRVSASLRALLEELAARGVGTELHRLEKDRRTGCFMCGQCGQRTGHITCSRPAEDGLRRCARRLKAADAVVIGTPVYSTHGSPATQRLLTRLDHDRLERGDRRLEGKPAAVVVDPASTGAHVVAARLEAWMRASGMLVVDASGLRTEGGAGPDRVAADAPDGISRLAASLWEALTAGGA